MAALLGWSGPAAFFAGFVPGRAGSSPIAALLTPLSATLVHAGIAHLLLNLLILLFCGRAVETILGGPALVFLYVVGAFAAAAAHFAVDPGDTVPMVGASGAISAVIGAYAILFGRNRVRLANPLAALLVNALWLAAAWILLQLLVGFTFETAGARIAVAAHIGGFLTGLVLANPLLLWRYRRA